MYIALSNCYAICLVSRAIVVMIILMWYLLLTNICWCSSTELNKKLNRKADSQNLSVSDHKVQPILLEGAFFYSAFQSKLFLMSPVYTRFDAVRKILH